MKAVVWQAPGQIDLEEVPDARIEQPGDSVVRLTMSAVCGTDLHMVRGTMPGLVPGTVLGHDGVGVVEVVGDNVRGFVPGDRLVVPSTICCGICVCCRAGHTSQCDDANPNGPAAVISFFSFFGGSESTGQRGGRPGATADPDRADRRRGQCLPQVRHPPARVGEGGAGSGGVIAVSVVTA